jgi:hypothetical protein
MSLSNGERKMVNVRLLVRLKAEPGKHNHDIADILHDGLSLLHGNKLITACFAIPSEPSVAGFKP